MGTPLPENAQATAEYIVECAGKTAGLNTARGDVAHWAAAVNLLLDQERFADAHYAVRQLRVPFPDAEFVANLTVVLDHLPAQATANRQAAGRGYRGAPVLRRRHLPVGHAPECLSSLGRPDARTLDLPSGFSRRILSRRSGCHRWRP